MTVYISSIWIMFSKGLNLVLMGIERIDVRLWVVEKWARLMKDSQLVQVRNCSFISVGFFLEGEGGVKSDRDEVLPHFQPKRLQLGDGMCVGCGEGVGERSLLQSPSKAAGSWQQFSVGWRSKVLSFFACCACMCECEPSWRNSWLVSQPVRASLPRLSLKGLPAHVASTQCLSQSLIVSLPHHGLPGAAKPQLQ